MDTSILFYGGIHDYNSTGGINRKKKKQKKNVGLRQKVFVCSSHTRIELITGELSKLIICNPLFPPSVTIADIARNVKKRLLNA